MDLVLHLDSNVEVGTRSLWRMRSRPSVPGGAASPWWWMMPPRRVEWRYLDTDPWPWRPTPASRPSRPASEGPPSLAGPMLTSTSHPQNSPTPRVHTRRHSIHGSPMVFSSTTRPLYNIEAGAAQGYGGIMRSRGPRSQGNQGATAGGCPVWERGSRFSSFFFHRSTSRGRKSVWAFWGLTAGC